MYCESGSKYYSINISFFVEVALFDVFISVTSSLHRLYVFCSVRVSCGLLQHGLPPNICVGFSGPGVHGHFSL